MEVIRTMALVFRVDTSDFRVEDKTDTSVFRIKDREVRNHREGIGKYMTKQKSINTKMTSSISENESHF